MREDPVLHTGQEHHREFQSLGGVQCHQRDHPAVLIVVGNLIRIGDEGDLLQELHQGRSFVCGREFLRDRFKFGEVLHPCFILRVQRRLEFGYVTGLLEHRLQDGGCIGSRFGQGPQRLHHLREGTHGIEGPGS